MYIIQKSKRQQNIYHFGVGRTKKARLSWRMFVLLLLDEYNASRRSEAEAVKKSRALIVLYVFYIGSTRERSDAALP